MTPSEHTEAALDSNEIEVVAELLIEARQAKQAWTDAVRDIEAHMARRSR